ncbi:MAG: hypothetical protein M3R24_02325 [Chloroflexota bacterium]|nr:hypothetical protein [Chloroflexota bacterium]
MARQTRPWFMLSITHGNLLQGGGLLGSLALLAYARRLAVLHPTRLMLTSWFITYFCNHAIAHWAVGRLLGIRFVGYGVHGTTSPQWYPPGLRWLFCQIPFFSARTDGASLREAHPVARLAMYLAAPVFTLVTGLGIPCYGRATRIPRSDTLLVGASLWFIPMIIVESLRAGGDLHRSWRELRGIRDRGTRLV